MQQGTHVYFTVMGRKTHETPYGKPDGPKTVVQDDSDAGDWFYCGNSRWKYIAEPWSGKGNGYSPQFPESHRQTQEVWAKTDENLGWWQLSYAILGLDRLQRASDAGEFVFRDPSSNAVTQRYWYEFKIVKVTVSLQVQDLTVTDMVQQLTGQNKASPDPLVKGESGLGRGDLVLP